MSDLTKFRDHCRAMAAADHKPECFTQAPQGSRYWNGQRIPIAFCCEGCNLAADRALFALLAAEVDEYLAPQPDLFGEMTAEPSAAHTAEPEEHDR